MRMTAAAEYGCLALLAIGERGEEWTKRQEIIDRFDRIPAAFLEQILRKLISGGFLISRRGAEGGFRLARPPREVVIADVVRAMDGPLAPTRSVSENFYQPSPVEASAGFHALFRRVRDAIAEILESTTLEDVMKEERKRRKKK
jgi:Rrf2 family cysteine metabolism transcriptional repressor